MLGHLYASLGEPKVAADMFATDSQVCSRSSG